MNANSYIYIYISHTFKHKALIKPLQYAFPVISLLVNMSVVLGIFLNFLVTTGSGPEIPPEGVLHLLQSRTIKWNDQSKTVKP